MANKPLRAVIDTNHIISAILSRRGASSKLIDWLTSEEDYFQLLLSAPIWREYETVARWLIPDSLQPEMQRVLDVVRYQAIWVEPAVELQVCRDRSDNRFLECAVAGRADYLVTKNIKHFPYKEHQGVKIVRIRVFLEALEKLAERPYGL